jgi:hypothetical protein
MLFCFLNTNYEENGYEQSKIIERMANYFIKFNYFINFGRNFSLLTESK